jgi:hypothetical protein
VPSAKGLCAIFFCQGADEPQGMNQSEVLVLACVVDFRLK